MLLFLLLYLLFPRKSKETFRITQYFTVANRSDAFYVFRLVSVFAVSKTILNISVYTYVSQRKEEKSSDGDS